MLLSPTHLYPLPYNPTPHPIPTPNPPPPGLGLRLPLPPNPILLVPPARLHTRAPPPHRTIQTTLVEMGDKPVAFVGSTQWIGAIELGYVLDQMLRVSWGGRLGK